MTPELKTRIERLEALENDSMKSNHHGMEFMSEADLMMQTIRELAEENLKLSEMKVSRYDKACYENMRKKINELIAENTQLRAKMEIAIEAIDNSNNAFTQIKASWMLGENWFTKGKEGQTNQIVTWLSRGVKFCTDALAQLRAEPTKTEEK